MDRRLSNAIADRIADAVEAPPRAIVAALRAGWWLIDPGYEAERLPNPRVLAILERLYGHVPHRVDRWAAIPPVVLTIQLVALAAVVVFCAGCSIAAAIDGQGLLSAAFAAFAAFGLLVTISLRGQGYSVLRAYRLRLGRCERCGYDLHRAPDRCPECGTPPAAPSAP